MARKQQRNFCNIHYLATKTDHVETKRTSCAERCWPVLIHSYKSLKKRGGIARLPNCAETNASPDRTCWTPLNAEGTREEKSTSVRALGSKKAEVQENFNTLSGRAHVMFVRSAAAHIVATIASDLRIHTLSPNQFLTHKITHPSPAALCAILPTLRENKGLLVSLCCTSTAQEHVRCQEQKAPCSSFKLLGYGSAKTTTTGYSAKATKRAFMRAVRLSSRK